MRHTLTVLAPFAAMFIFIEYFLVLRYQEYGSAAIMGVFLVGCAALDLRNKKRERNR